MDFWRKLNVHKKKEKEKENKKEKEEKNNKKWRRAKRKIEKKNKFFGTNNVWTLYKVVVKGKKEGKW